MLPCAWTVTVGLLSLFLVCLFASSIAVHLKGEQSLTAQYLQLRNPRNQPASRVQWGRYPLPADNVPHAPVAKYPLLLKMHAGSAQLAPNTQIPLDQVFRCLLPSVIHTPRSSCLSAEHVLQACVHPHTTMTPALWHPVCLAADLNALDGFTKSSNNGYYSTSPECVAFSTSDPLSREQVCLSLC